MISDGSSGTVGERFVTRAPVRTTTATTDTWTAADLDGLIIYDNAAAVTVTIPATSVVSFPVGTLITSYCKGAGGLTILKTGSDVIQGFNTAAQTFHRRVYKISEANGISTWLGI